MEKHVSIGHGQHEAIQKLAACRGGQQGRNNGEGAEKPGQGNG